MRACRYLGLGGLTCLVILGSVTAGQARAEVSVEYRVKAAFLYNFTRFVEWPATAFSGADKLTLCVAGRDPFGPALDSITGKKVRGRTLAVKKLGSRPRFSDCQVVFISGSERKRLKSLLSRVQGRPVLTVGDVDGFTRSGGIIQFTVVNNKVRFGINIDAAERAGLKISSKLLHLATVSGDRPR